MDAVIVVSADQRTQVARLSARDGLSRAEALARIRSQAPLADKRRVADYVIDGRRPRAEIRREVARIYAELTAAQPRLGHGRGKR
jgi:dephospho-CoA kinase